LNDRLRSVVHCQDRRARGREVEAGCFAWEHDRGAKQMLDVLSSQNGRAAGSLIAVVIGLAVGWPHLLAAQSSGLANDPVKVGDRWVYEIRDEASGYPRGGYTDIVTEVSPREIVLNRTFSGAASGGSESVLVAFDREWNAIDNLVWKFEPNNGQGIRPPLSLGKAWQAEFDAKNLDTGAIYKGMSASKVVGTEPITTSAGTFDTFKIEHKSSHVSSTDASKMWESEIVVWYAPQINHWVRQTTLVTFEKRMRLNIGEELADYTRKF
jgi:hypothetical protein